MTTFFFFDISCQKLSIIKDIPTHTHTHYYYYFSVLFHFLWCNSNYNYITQNSSLHLKFRVNKIKEESKLLLILFISPAPTQLKLKPNHVTIKIHTCIHLELLKQHGHSPPIYLCPFFSGSLSLAFFFFSFFSFWGQHFPY